MGAHKPLRRYGFSDFVTKEIPDKYIKVYNADGELLGEVECYYIEDENED